MEVRKKGIGIVGYGGFGEFIRAAWDRMDNARVVAISDSDPSRAPGDLRFYDDIEPMLADPEVDIVSIATPPNSHKDLAILALSAGKHVLIEKPLALSVSDALAVKKAAADNNLVASVDFMLRFNSIVETLREIVRSQVLGKLRRVDLRNYAMRDQVPEGHWFWDPRVSGRILLEHGVHFFDIAHSLTDSPADEVAGLGVEIKPGMEDRVFAAITYADGVVGTFWHSFSRPKALERTSFHFAFDLGEIDMFGWIPLELKAWGWTNDAGLNKLRELPHLADLDQQRLDVDTAHSSDTHYAVSRNFTARYVLPDDKAEVYAQNLQSIMADVIAAIDDPSHKLRVTIDDAVEAVRTAELATRFIHPNEDYSSPRA